MAYRINAVRLICDAIPELQLVAPEQRPQVYQRRLQDIARYRLPERDKRSNPWVVKRKMSNVHLKRAEHRPWPHPSLTFPAAVVILN